MSGLTYMITGANKGIGKGLLEFYLARPNTTVIATVRDVASGTKILSALAVGTGSKLIVVKIDSKSAIDAAKAAEELKTKHGISKIDTLIANAGYMGKISPVLQTTPDSVREHFEVNVLGPLVLFQAFYPLLEASPAPKLLVLTSSIGSIGLMEGFPVPFFAYGISKGAANFLVRKIHFEHPNLTSMAFNPGWVQTDMGTGAAKGVGMEDAPTTLAEAVPQLVKLFDEANRERSGTFTAATGESLAW